ncbi:MAG: Holliday junction branch migration protein RuvA [Spirochaetia bacterium]|nr:Holliday junction branch migration protein RuvA [Spirochaetia bacterium]
MIHSLYGRISGQNGRFLYLRQGGIEWSIEVSLQSLEDLVAQDEEVRVFTHLHHREDHMQLYGFSTEDERDLFLEIIKVSGIGPKQALRMLSGLRPQEFIDAIDNDRVDRLSQLPGVGKKTAGKIILSLRGKILTEKQDQAADRHPELVNALTDMGFDRKRAGQALQEVAKSMDSDTLSDSEQEHELFRRAIVYLSGSS